MKQFNYNDLPKLLPTGTRFKVHGWIMAKGVEEGTYEVIESGEQAVKFVRVNKRGALLKTELHFSKSFLFGYLNTFLRGDNNGIELLN